MISCPAVAAAAAEEEEEEVGIYIIFIIVDWFLVTSKVYYKLQLASA